MKQFDIHRFGWVLRTDLIQNRKFYLSMLLGGLIAMVCGQLGPVYVLIKMGHAESIDIERHASDLLFTFLVVYFIFTTYSVANTFRCLSTKEERINYFMLPASNLEKYLSRILIHVVGGMLACYSSSWLTASEWGCSSYSPYQPIPSFLLYGSKSPRLSIFGRA